MEKQQEIERQIATQLGALQMQVIALQVELAAARQRNEALEAQVKAAGAP